MGATHFLTKTLPKVAAEMALSVLAYNLTRAQWWVDLQLTLVLPMIDHPLVPRHHLFLPREPRFCQPVPFLDARYQKFV